nr:16S rRNA (uracil(1498)-N(3))-methyltransferase [Aquibacillus saliphilus]
MQRYFVSESNWSTDDVVTITGNDVHHITRVMRMDKGDEIICNHLDGRSATCTIEQVSSDFVIANVVEWRDEKVELPVHVTIAQGLPKSDKLDLILQKGTELGASAFIPFQADRSVVKWDQKKIVKKLDRFKKIVKEASEQSHRSFIPTVESIYSFKQLLEDSQNYDVKLFAYEEEARSDNFQKLSDVLNQIQINHKVIACIGPEGGYTIEEVNALKQAGFHSVRLGPRILRTETASLYLLASISYHFEELR